MMQRRLTMILRFAEAVLDGGLPPGKVPTLTAAGARLQSLKGLVEQEIRSRLRTTTTTTQTGERVEGTEQRRVYVPPAMIKDK